MSDETTVTELLELIRTHYAEWQTALSRVPAERMAEGGIVGGWSAKDLIAHITWSEREMLTVLRARAFKGSDWWNLELDARNQLIYEESKDRTLAEIKAEHQEVHRALVEEIGQLSDDELNDGSHFDDMPPEWSMAMLLPGNTYVHYREHAADLRAWLEAGEENS